MSCLKLVLIPYCWSVALEKNFFCIHAFSDEILNYLLHYRFLLLFYSRATDYQSGTVDIATVIVAVEMGIHIQCHRSLE